MREGTAVIVIFLAFVILLTLLVKGFAMLMGRFAGSGVRQIHESAEYIIATGEIPRDWLHGEARGVRWLRRMRQADPRQQITGRMDRLITHFESSPLVADEPTRELLLSQLRAAHDRWMDGNAGSTREFVAR